jgi:ATP-dependent Lhr-like helicase
VDWTRRHAFVEPSDERGRSRWGMAGVALSHQLCQAIAGALRGRTPQVEWSQRAQTVLSTVRESMRWVDPSSTAVVGDDEGRLAWWTFAGLKANLALAQHLNCSRSLNTVTNLVIPLASDVTPAAAAAAINDLRTRRVDQLLPSPSPRAVAGLKFNECLPVDLAMETLAARLRDDAAVSATLAKPVASVRR